MRNETPWLPANSSVVLVLFVATTTSACLPIPWPRDALVRPEADFTVQRADSGEPVEGATVRLCRTRIGPPPEEVLEEWSEKTGTDGRASFSYKEESEMIMPLMMHGVPQRAWYACVEAEGFQPAEVSRNAGRLLVEQPSGEPAKMGKNLDIPVVQLQPEDGKEHGYRCPCDMQPSGPGAGH